MVVEILAGIDVILAVAAGYLYLSEPKGLDANNKLKAKRLMVLSQLKREEEVDKSINDLQTHGSVLKATTSMDLSERSVLNKSLGILSRETRSAHERIGRLEAMLSDLEKGDSLKKDFDTGKLSDRLEKMDDFRREAKIELEAIKYQLASVTGKSVTPKPKTRRTGEVIIWHSND